MKHTKAAGLAVVGLAILRLLIPTRNPGHADAPLRLHPTRSTSAGSTLRSQSAADRAPTDKTAPPATRKLPTAPTATFRSDRRSVAFPSTTRTRAPTRIARTGYRRHPAHPAPHARHRDETRPHTSRYPRLGHTSPLQSQVHRNPINVDARYLFDERPDS